MSIALLLLCGCMTYMACIVEQNIGHNIDILYNYTIHRGSLETLNIGLHSLQNEQLAVVGRYAHSE